MGLFDKFRLNSESFSVRGYTSENPDGEWIQDLLGKIGKLNNLNNNEIKATSEVENITVNEEPNNIEDIYKDRKKEIETNSKKIEEDQNKEDRPKGGRHF